MTTRDIGSVLKDVVAYVDVWSSEKTANYSKPFIQQLQEMGAQVSKTFNKHVTHVVFSNGHPATWRKAKKSNVRLVSVLWIGRCFDDRMHVDEDLYPALNDETNPVLKNKKHRCMQPKDSPEKTPETDRRMKRKLDKMMKDLPSKQPLVTDVSPIIIDQESGIVYSPALKRSDYMARRLKDMKKKRENLSPTASQMVECCSPTELKPSLGSTPTVFKLMFDQSDDDSSASAAEPGCSPDKEERRTQLDVGERGHHGKRHKKSSEKPWMSPCHVLPKTISSPVKCPDFEETQDVEVNSQRKSRRSIVRKKPAEKCEISCQDARTDVSKNFDKEKRRSQIKSSSLSPNKSEKGKRKKMKAAESFTPASIHPGDVKSSSCRSSAATSSVAAAELLKETATSLEKRQQRTPKKTRRSLYASVRSLTLSGESRVASSSTAGDDDVFEDYFSPANHNIRQISERPLLANLQIEEDIHIPFELDPVPKKRKQRGESTESETNSKKKKKLEESQSGKLCSRQSNASSHQLEDVKELQPSLDSSSANVTLVKKRRRQSTLPFTSTGTTESDAVKRRRESASVQSKSKEVSEVQKNLENEGNERAHAAGLTEIPSEVEENHNKQVILGLTGPVSKTKAMRTLVMTSMPTEKQNTVVQVVKVLGGFSIADRVCESTTHVVSGSHRRTLNILFGIARGCWILSFEWILWCLEQRQWIPEEPYELSDQFPAAQICRLQRHLSAGEHQQDLFQDQPAMFVSQHSQPPTQSLVELIQLCGGTACKTVRQAGICIGRYSGRRPEGSRILSEQWVLDCITHLKLLPYENYDLE